MATVLLFTAACKGDFAAGVTNTGGTGGSAPQAGAVQDGGNLIARPQDSGNPNAPESRPSTATGSVPCDPFQPPTKPITLTNVLGAGQDTDGTLYVVDQPQPGSERVYVSSGATLQRQRIAGLGIEGNASGGSSYTFSISDHVPPFTLRLNMNTAGPTAMGVLLGTTDGKTFTIGQQGDVLTLVPASQVVAMPVANIPAATYIECNATIPDGRGLLVVRPLDDWTLTDFRVFFGTADRMLERPVDQVEIFMGGDSGTIVNFAIDGVAAVTNCTATLTIGATSFPLTLRPTDSPPASETYFCLGNPSVDGGVDAWGSPTDGPSCRVPSPDYGPTSVFPFLPSGSPAATTTCPAACGDSAWSALDYPNIDTALPYGSCEAGTPTCDVMARVPCACDLSSGPLHVFNCSCESGAWTCGIRVAGMAMCMPCPDAGVGDGGNDAGPAPQGIFTPTGNMTVPRFQHTATLLPSGKVLIAGGQFTDPMGEMGLVYDTSGAELYDLAAESFTATGGMSAARFGHSATLLPSGKVLIAGGADRRDGLSMQGLASAELYDPAAGTFTATGGMNTVRYGHTATLLPSGKVLIAGGDASGTSAELYDPAAGTFTATGTVTTGAQTATLLLSGKVLVTGVDAGAELYDPAAGTFTATGSMAVARSAHTATLLPSGKVLVAGGFDGRNLLASAELYDPVAGLFTSTGSLTTARELQTATLLPNGKVLVVGGTESWGTPAAANAELYDPAAGTFTATANMNVARFGQTATLLPSGAVLVVGGKDSGDDVLASAELYQ